MGSLYSVIISVLAWITSGGVLIVLYSSLFLHAMPIWAVVLITAIIIGGALGTTWLALSHAADYHYR
jgi:hypothetical protein